MAVGAASTWSQRSRTAMGSAACVVEVDGTKLLRGKLRWRGCQGGNLGQGEIEREREVWTRIIIIGGVSTE